MLTAENAVILWLFPVSFIFPLPEVWKFTIQRNQRSLITATLYKTIWMIEDLMVYMSASYKNCMKYIKLI